MGDVVIRLPVRDGQEAALFGDYLNRFLQACPDQAGYSADNDAPYLMVHSDPQSQGDLKILTFQQGSAALAFRSGWDAAAEGLSAAGLAG